MNHPARWLLVMLLVGGLCATAWSLLELSDASDRADAARIAALRVAEIHRKLQLAAPPQRTVVSAVRIDNLPRVIAEAAEAVGVFGRLSARPIEDRPVPRDPGRIEAGQHVSLRDVTLEQALRFLRDVSEMHEALRTSEVSLEPAPPSATGEERWNVETSITYIRPATSAAPPAPRPGGA